MFKFKYLWLMPVVLLLGGLMLFTVACDEDEEGAEETPTAATPGTPGVGGPLGTVNVLGIWGAEELTSFEAVVQPWQDETGGTMEFTGTRSITADLTLRVEGGNPPDVAIPAEIGLFQEFATNGQIVPLSECEGLEEMVRDQYPDSFIELGTVDGTLYGFFMKADSKGTIWYDPQTFDANGWEPLGADNSFDDLISLSEEILATGLPPWSIGVGAAEATGFAGTDWIQQIILNDAGPDTYDGLVDGSIPFTDAAVMSAWERFGEIALTSGYVVQGGGDAIVATNFQDATFPPFEDPPTAAMNYLGSFAVGFIQDQFPDAVPGTDFNFFTWPGGAITGGANIVYAFNSSPTTCSFLEYLAGADAQRIWVDRGGFTSVNQEVDLDAYPDDVSRNVAQQLLEAETFRFDLDDAIGGAFQSAYFQGVTQYLLNPGDLQTILQNIEASRGQ
jgi:alpha-glucoside transport system substrate-binding protein